MNWFRVGLGDGKLVLPIEGIGSASEDWNRCELQVEQSWGAPGGTWLEWIKYPHQHPDGGVSLQSLHRGCRARRDVVQQTVPGPV